MKVLDLFPNLLNQLGTTQNIKICVSIEVKGAIVYLSQRARGSV